jgi:hypothetical protein
MAEMFLECIIAYGNLHIWSLKNVGMFKDYVNKNRLLIGRTATTVAVVHHIMLQQ